LSPPAAEAPIPKELVEPIRSIAIKIVLGYFMRNPKSFVKWIDDLTQEAKKEGREFQAEEIRKVLSFGQPMCGCNYGGNP